MPDGLQTWVPAILIAVGVVGIVVPVLPGLLLVVVGVLVWALAVGTGVAWAVFGVTVVLYAAGVTLQYLVPGRRLRRAGVPTSTLVLGVALGIVGFFVVPVLGAPLGFVLGIYLWEHGRSRDASQAWARTKTALAAVATSMGIELLTALLIVVLWVVGLRLT